MPGNRRWTDEELRILRQLYGVIYVREIARILNRSERGICDKARRLRLRSNLRGRKPKYLNAIIR